MFQMTFRMFATRKLYQCKCAALNTIQVCVVVHWLFVCNKSIELLS